MFGVQWFMWFTHCIFTVSVNKHFEEKSDRAKKSRILFYKKTLKYDKNGLVAFKKMSFKARALVKTPAQKILLLPWLAF